MYGSSDSGLTVHNKYQEMNALMKKAGRALNIKPHWVIERKKIPPDCIPQRVFLCAPGDIEGITEYHGQLAPYINTFCK